MLSAFSIIVRLAYDLIQWCGLLLRPRESLEAEMMFLRRQLALYRERGVRPKRVDAATRVSLAFLSRWFDWCSALVVVRPETLIRWHRASAPLICATDHGKSFGPITSTVPGPKECRAVAGTDPFAPLGDSFASNLSFCSANFVSGESGNWDSAFVCTHALQVLTPSAGSLMRVDDSRATPPHATIDWSRGKWSPLCWRR